MSAEEKTHLKIDKMLATAAMSAFINQRVVY